MKAVKNNKLTVIYRGHNGGSLISYKWDDGVMRHHELEFFGQDSHGKFIHYTWSEISLFLFSGGKVHFEGKRSDGCYDSKTIHDVKSVEVL